jgi:ribosomal protein S18 acetylase RimI-like enzyme
MKKKKKTIGGFDPSAVVLRSAKLSDLTQLVLLENACFNYDQLTRRNFHWMITKANSIFLVIEYKTKLIGYGLVLINSGTSLARLYSIAVLDSYQGHGLASQIIAELEEMSSNEDCAYLRLEVKESNLGAIKLYQKLGYVQFSKKEDYYDNGETALCFEKRVRFLKKKPRHNVPYYQQSVNFTCGPACLMMAIKTFNPKYKMSMQHELQIWREATTIFMTSGHGGCGPRGLALSAWSRGYRPELYLSRDGALFVDSVRSPEKKKVIEYVHEDFAKRVKEAGIKIHQKRLTVKDIEQILDEGGLPIVLITTYHFDKNKVPHWVIVTGHDDHFIYIHDSDAEDVGQHEQVIGRIHTPIAKEQFLKTSRWGKNRMSAAVVIYRD